MVVIGSMVVISPTYIYIYIHMGSIDICMSIYIYIHGGITH